MQEEAGSVASKTKKNKKKEVKIPTVQEIVEAESLETGVSAEENDVEPAQNVENVSASAEKTQNPEDLSFSREDLNVSEKEEVSKKNSAASEDNNVTSVDGTLSAIDMPQGEEKPSESNLQEDETDKEAQEELLRKRAALNLDSETALVETVLFLESEPLPVENLGKITQLSEDVINECIIRLKEKYASLDSGIELSQIIGGWILTPKKECFDLVKERYGKKNEGRLSKAAIETLSIIAYSQPITRAEIESIRHVNVDNMMRILLDRNFVKEVGKKDVPGKPIMYGTTKEFLEFFHLQSIADLPQLDEKESERFELAR